MNRRQLEALAAGALDCLDTNRAKSSPTPNC
jgi:hypothetical protein